MVAGGADGSTVGGVVIMAADGSTRVGREMLILRARLKNAAGINGAVVIIMAVIGVESMVGVDGRTRDIGRETLRSRTRLRSETMRRMTGIMSTMLIHMAAMVATSVKLSLKRRQSNG
ncbi:hypothetical protein B0T21DRAFT_366074 [Apiosordaria backusii]|uniref:Uncharacterized protein n=1 Tax=Apiosordaria backusii TaxID=314023 RepID=A0AA40BKN0_9PEZI|nr:hypothetical protein B0T21DRAFT_366074 [Apiosordaria backusii]